MAGRIIEGLAESGLPARFDEHHIVERRNAARFGREAIEDPRNKIYLPREFHWRVNGLYSSKQVQITGEGFRTVRQWMDTMSYEEQYLVGLKILEYLRTGVWPR